MIKITNKNYGNIEEMSEELTTATDEEIARLGMFDADEATDLYREKRAKETNNYDCL